MVKYITTDIFTLSNIINYIKELIISMNKIYQKFLIYATTFAFSLFLCGCKNDKNNKNDFLDSSYEFLKTDSAFFDYYNDEDEIIEIDNMRFDLMSIKKEQNTSCSMVVMTIVIDGTSESIYQNKYDFIKKTDEEKFDVLKEVGDLLVDFAKSQEWDNDYYLYIDLERVPENDYVYDYEENVLYKPNNEELYINMYEKFQTFDKDELTKSQEGIDFLINNKMATYKHNELDIDYTPIGFSVYIDNNGKFNSYGEENAIRYYSEKQN